MTLDLKFQNFNHTLPPITVDAFTGSALPLELVGIPKALGGKRISAVNVTVTNASGIPVTAPAVLADGEWRVMFAATNFDTYGFVRNGVKIDVITSDGESVIFAVGDIEIKASTADATEGVVAQGLVRKGDDIYLPSYNADGVQHFMRETLVYSERQRAWGAEWTGDYIIVGGEYVAFTSEGQE